VRVRVFSFPFGGWPCVFTWLSIKMFEKGIGFMQLQKRLKAKWSLKGDFSLIDIGCDYFVTQFTNMKDYHHVLNQGPWLIDDNYLTI